MNKLKILISAIFGVFLLWSCDTNDKVPNGMSRLQVYMIDAPAAYEEVNVEIIDVLINRHEEDDSEWQSIGLIRPGIYNLLDFTGGIDTLLADVEIPAGEVKQIRLLLGDENSLRIDGDLVDLKTPSAQQSGLKIQINSTLQEGILYKVYLDFDAAMSVVKAGNSGQYILKPVIRASVESQGGSIRGTISPVDVTTAIYAIHNEDSVGTFANSEGHFLIRALATGSYTLSIVPAEGYLPMILDDVEVTDGEVNNVGLIILEPADVVEGD